MKRAGYAYLYVNLLFLPLIAISKITSNVFMLLMVFADGLSLLALLGLTSVYWPTILLFIILRIIGERFDITRAINKKAFWNTVLAIIIYNHVFIYLALILIAD